MKTVWSRLDDSTPLYTEAIGLTRIPSIQSTSEVQSLLFIRPAGVGIGISGEHHDHETLRSEFGDVIFEASQRMSKYSHELCNIYDL